ncbi:hypothetical protein E2C01_045606 [Portunus trituberculatus]|uniref:Secreted protein n=1 Tax=Portunus trituberculatus TaxID=210409 RepID=A0A5B7G3F8_PORTR|nr:hypothetical protein [Portunus trituberculatus]
MVRFATTTTRLLLVTAVSTSRPRATFPPRCGRQTLGIDQASQTPPLGTTLPHTRLATTTITFPSQAPPGDVFPSQPRDSIHAASTLFSTPPAGMAGNSCIYKFNKVK